MLPRLNLLAILLGCGALVSAPAAAQRPLPDFDAFTAQVKARLQTDSDLQAGYTFRERRVEQRLDRDGRVTRETVKVFEVYPGLPGEEPYRRLIEENGRPVAPEKLEKVDRERRRDVEAYARRQQRPMSDADRQKAIRAYEKWQRERAADIDDIFNVFDVRMVGREAIDGHDTIAFTLRPRPNARPRTDSGRMMRHFNANAWISESDYELVRVEVEAVDTVSFGLGLLARLHEGTTASYQRRKVNGERWLPERMTYRGSGRMLLVRRLRLGGLSEFSDYRRFEVDTTTTIGSPEGQ